MIGRSAILNLGATEVVSFSATHAENTAATVARTLLVVTDTDCFANASAVATNTNSAFFPAKVPFTVSLAAGAQLSFVGAGAGKAYVTDVKLSA